MITILPADKEAVDRLAAAEEAALDRGMVMAEREAVLGHMLYAVEGDTAVLGNVVCEERMLADGLLRAVFNAARNAGCKKAVYRRAQSRAFLSGYGFREKGEELEISIAGFFDGGCKGCSGDCENCGK